MSREDQLLSTMTPVNSEGQSDLERTPDPTQSTGPIALDTNKFVNNIEAVILENLRRYPPFNDGTLTTCANINEARLQYSQVSVNCYEVAYDTPFRPALKVSGDKCQNYLVINFKVIVDSDGSISINSIPWDLGSVHGTHGSQIFEFFSNYDNSSANYELTHDVAADGKVDGKTFHTIEDNAKTGLVIGCVLVPMTALPPQKLANYPDRPSYYTKNSNPSDISAGATLRYPSFRTRGDCGGTRGGFKETHQTTTHGSSITLINRAIHAESPTIHINQFVPIEASPEQKASWHSFLVKAIQACMIAKPLELGNDTEAKAQDAKVKTPSACTVKFANAHLQLQFGKRNQHDDIVQQDRITIRRAFAGVCTKPATDQEVFDCSHMHINTDTLAMRAAVLQTKDDLNTLVIFNNLLGLPAKNDTSVATLLDELLQSSEAFKTYSDVPNAWCFIVYTLLESHNIPILTLLTQSEHGFNNRFACSIYPALIEAAITGGRDSLAFLYTHRMPIHPKWNTRTEIDTALMLYQKAANNNNVTQLETILSSIKYLVDQGMQTQIPAHQAQLQRLVTAHNWPSSVNSRQTQRVFNEIATRNLLTPLMEQPTRDVFAACSEALKHSEITPAIFQYLTLVINAKKAPEDAYFFILAICQPAITTIKASAEAIANTPPRRLPGRRRTTPGIGPQFLRQATRRSHLIAPFATLDPSKPNMHEMQKLSALEALTKSLLFRLFGYDSEFVEWQIESSCNDGVKLLVLSAAAYQQLRNSTHYIATDDKTTSSDVDATRKEPSAPPQDKKPAPAAYPGGAGLGAGAKQTQHLDQKGLRLGY